MSLSLRQRLTLVLPTVLLLALPGCLYESAEDESQPAPEVEAPDTPTPDPSPEPTPGQLPQLALCDGECDCSEMLQGPANDTGVQFTGLIPSGNQSICDGLADPQDCHFGRDRLADQQLLTKSGAGPAGFDFIKLGANGEQLADDAEQWQCVLDAHTGLMWEVKQAEGSDGLRAGEQSYSWADSNLPDYSSPGLGACRQVDCDTESFVNATNAEGLCGFSDWRLPSRIELQDIVNYGERQPSISSDYFPNVRAVGYWSSTLDTDDPGSIWSVNFNFGTVASGSSAATLGVILVRDSDSRSRPQFSVTENELDAELRSQVAPSQRCSSLVSLSAPNSRFLQDTAGNVFDRLTGLIWKRCLEGVSGALCDQGEPQLLTWEQAIAAGELASRNADLSGQARWRLPNIKELQRTMETACEEPPLNPFVFPNMTLDQVWSATPHVALDGRGFQYQYQNSIIFYVARVQTQQVHLVRQCE